MLAKIVQAAAVFAEARALRNVFYRGTRGWVLLHRPVVFVEQFEQPIPGLQARRFQSTGQAQVVRGGLVDFARRLHFQRIVLCAEEPGMRAGVSDAIVPDGSRHGDRGG